MINLGKLAEVFLVKKRVGTTRELSLRKNYLDQARS